MTTATTDYAGGPPPQRIRIAVGFGLTAIVVFFALALRSPTALYLGLFLALIGFGLAADRTLPVLVREPLFWVAVVVFVWVLGHGWIDLATAEARGFVVDEGAVWHHARYTLLLPMILALWLAAGWRHRHVLFLLVGFAALIFYIVNADNLFDITMGSAMGAAGLFSATLLFLSAGLIGSIWQVRDEYTPAVRNTLLGLAGLMLLMNVAVLVISISRAAWLATFGAFVVLALIGGWFLWKHGNAFQRRVTLAVSGGFLLLLVVAFALAWDLVATRLMREMDGIVKFITQGYEPGERYGPSVGARLRMYSHALEEIAERPWLGVGTASVRDLDRNFHSTYLHLMVAMGIPWTLLWLGTHVWAVWRAARELIVRDRDIFLAFGLAGAAMAHFGTLVFQGGRLWSAQGSALYLVLMTIICAVFLRGAVRRQGLARE